MKKTGTILWNFIEGIARFILIKLLRLKFTDEAWANLMQFVKFAIVGLTNTLIGYVVYILTLNILKWTHICADYEYVVAQISMYVLSVLWSFYWNNKAVFKQEEGEKRSWPAALLKTYVSYAFTSLLLSEGLLYLEIEIWGWSDTISPLVNLLITVPLNFVIQKFWAFKAVRHR